MTLNLESLESGDLETRVPLSHTQQFLRMFDQGDEQGPFSARYNIVVGWRVRGPLDPPTLEAALEDLVDRHDALRATIVRDDETGYQTIAPSAPPELTVLDLGPQDSPRARDARAEELCGDLEAGSYDSRALPHLRVFLGRFDERDAVLVLVVHHTAGDGWSMQLLMRDLAACYARRRGFEAPLPEAASYAEYARWQTGSADPGLLEFSQEYWRDKLGDARMLGVPTDHPRSAGLPKTSPVHRFALPAGTTAAALALAAEMRASAFMVTLAAYKLMLARRLSATDIVIPTLTSGRTEPRFDDTVGPFFNFVPLRTDLSGVRTFREAVERTRATCLEAYSYELPFAHMVSQAPELMAPLAEDRLAACAFQAWQFSTVLTGQRVGDLEYAEVRERLLHQADGTDIPDGALLTLDIDPDGRIFGNIAYNANLYSERTAVELASGFCEVLIEGAAAPDAPLDGP